MHIIIASGMCLIVSCFIFTKTFLAIMRFLSPCKILCVSVPFYTQLLLYYECSTHTCALTSHTIGGLTLAASSKDSTREYLLVVPDPSSDGKKLPPEKPAPYGATHTYVNQSSIPTE